jgi:hypothetical protein
MGRRKSIAQLQAQLNAAQKRAEYYAVPHPPDLTKPITRRPKTTILYPSMFSPADAPDFIWVCNEASLEKLGGVAALGITLAASSNAAKEGAPDGFRPAEIHGRLPNVAAPERVQARASGATYIRYAPGTPYAENPQYNFSAPIAGATKEPLALLTQFKAAVTASELPNESHFYLTQERFPVHQPKEAA